MNKKDTAPFLGHCPTEENPAPLPSGRQIGEKANIYFADDRLVPIAIEGVSFHDCALYYHCHARVVRLGVEWVLPLDIPATLLVDALPLRMPEASPMEKIHAMIHEASVAISEGEIEKGKKILADADQYSHDHC